VALKSEFRVQCRPTSRSTTAAGNGISGCRDQAPKIVIQARERLQRPNPGIKWPEIPAETPYFASREKRAVCGDWMVVEAVRYEPVSDCNSLIRAVLQGIFREIRAFAQKRS
jgi:hypothetical protein